MTFRTPEWIKPGIWGAIIGVVVVAIVGFSAGWIVTGGTAQQTAESHAEKAVLAALTPICVAQFYSETQTVQTTQLAALEDESSWKRSDLVEKQGWATMPGSTEPNSQVGNACASELMKLAEK